MQRVNVLKESHKFFFDLGLLGKLFNVKVGSKINAT
jgi:hypothetical protein